METFTQKLRAFERMLKNEASDDEVSDEFFDVISFAGDNPLLVKKICESVRIHRPGLCKDLNIEISAA